MSLAEDSPVHSSSSDDFAAFLDAELDSASDPSADLEEVAEEEEESGNDDKSDYGLDLERVKRRKVELSRGITNPESSSSQGEPAQVLGSSSKNDICRRPGVYAGMCLKCGQKMDDESAVAFGYIHKNLRLANDEISRLCDKNLKNLLCSKKLYLVLDLDHTLLNSLRLLDITEEEGYLNGQRDALPGHIRTSFTCRSSQHSRMESSNAERV